MTNVFKALSALLSYPTDELRLAVGEISEAVEAATAIPDRIRAHIHKLLHELATNDLLDLQERYVLLFDRTRSLSLHLFEHVHGESRDRGQAMIDLQALYRKHGLEISAAELPDYIPLFLEFLSTRPVHEACDLLGQPAHILSALAERLRKRNSYYEGIFRALVVLAAAKPQAAALSALLQEPDVDANDFAALDKSWEDEPVRFGPDANDACKDNLIARVRAGRRPAPDMPAKPAARPQVTRSSGERHA